MGWDQTASLIVTILVAVLGGVLYNGVQFRQIDKRFEQIDRRFEHVLERFGEADKRFE